MIGSLREKLARTRLAFKLKFDAILKSGRSHEGILEALTESLILADVGVGTAERIIAGVKGRASGSPLARGLKSKGEYSGNGLPGKPGAPAAVEKTTKKPDSFESVRDALKTELLGILSRYPAGFRLDDEPGVLMMVGVNGGGKTTSLAKLARRFAGRGRKPLLVAADTFRAAAQEQLAVWGRRLDLPVIKGPYGADPASVVFDAARHYISRSFDAMLVDTAGRIHTNTNLMSELEKVKRIIGREMPGEPREILLVLDASIGQNALPQAREFLKFAGITGIFLSKLDGTAKGGSVISIIDELALPIKFIGTGEGQDDLLEFSAESFVNALFE